MCAFFTVCHMLFSILYKEKRTSNKVMRESKHIPELFILDSSTAMRKGQKQGDRLEHVREYQRT
jgi:hypothetical protein